MEALDREGLEEGGGVEMNLGKRERNVWVLQSDYGFVLCCVDSASDWCFRDLSFYIYL